jgi:hypothetical protein
MDLDVNTTDERIYSVFRGLLQDGLCTLQIFLLDVSARRRQRTGTDSRRKTVGPIGAKTLPCGKTLFNRRHLLLWRKTCKKRFDSILFRRLEIFAQVTILINFNISSSLQTVSMLGTVQRILLKSLLVFES